MELMTVAKYAGEDSLRRVLLQYKLKNKKSIRDSLSIRWIGESVISSKDIGFDVLLHEKDLVENVLGKEWRSGLL